MSGGRWAVKVKVRGPRTGPDRGQGRAGHGRAHCAGYACLPGGQAGQGGKPVKSPVIVRPRWMCWVVVVVVVVERMCWVDIDSVSLGMRPRASLPHPPSVAHCHPP